jgi:hypothetical protein
MKFPDVITIGSERTVLGSMDDFVNLVGDYMGHDARRFLRDILAENDFLWNEYQQLIDKLYVKED